MSQRFEGVAVLPVPIRFAREVLGKSFDGVIECGTFRLTLPRGSDDPLNDSSELWPPFPDRPRLLLRSPEESWGGGYSYLQGDPDLRPASNSIERVVFELSANATSDDETFMRALAFGHEIDGWLERAINWLELWTDQPLFVDANHGLLSAGTFWRVDREPMEQSGWHPPLRGYVGGVAVSLAMMQSACIRANRIEVVPDQWRIFVRSERWNNDRLRVIDATTAAEMSVEQRLDTELAAQTTLSSDQRAKRIREASGIVEKLSMLESLVPPEHSLIARVADRVAGPRNDAVHGGMQPAEGVAQRLADTAKQLMDTYTPIAAP